MRGDSGAGCIEVDEGLHRGEFRTAGQYDCLELPAPSGARVAALTALADDDDHPVVEVIDRTGSRQCPAWDLASGTCELSGSGPFRALASARVGFVKGPYGLVFHRTDTVPQCPKLPSGTFADDSPSATLTTGEGVFARCLIIPAKQHTGSEMFQLHSSPGAPAARFVVVGTDGRKACDHSPTTDGFILCRPTEGEAQTVLFTGRDEGASYTLTRRDVTATASGCPETTATAVGGASVKGGSGSAGRFRCHRVTTTAASDVLRLDVRDPYGTATVLALDAAGNPECSFTNRACIGQGSTSHQVITYVPPGKQVAPEYRLDAWRVATASGPAPECNRVTSVAYGYGPLTGTLSESKGTGICAVLPTGYADRFQVAISDTGGSGHTAVPSLYNREWTDGCYKSTQDYQCAVVNGSPSKDTSTLFVLSLPDTSPETSYRAELTCLYGICGNEHFGVDSVSPTSAPSGSTVTLTVKGTALHQDDTVRLVKDGVVVRATTVSVSADWRTLTARLDLTGVAPGAWTVSVISHRSLEAQPATFTVTPAD